MNRNARRAWRRFFAATAACSLSAASLAQTTPAPSQPRWELGLGGAVMSVPDYRGSDEQRFYALPLPYLIYRGKFLRIDRQRVQGLLAESKRMTVDISLNASTPVNSSRNRTRAGMPDLDPTLEIGPSLEIFLNPGETRPLASFRLPLRAVLGVAKDFSHVRQVGWLTQPNFNVDWYNIGPGHDWNVGAAVGPLFATRQYHDYFYSVSPDLATAARPAYDAPGGYSGMRLIATVSRRLPRYWLGAFFRYDNLQGVAFNDSPLLKKRHDLMAGIGMAYIFAQSKEAAAYAVSPAREPVSGQTAPIP